MFERTTDGHISPLDAVDDQVYFCWDGKLKDHRGWLFKCEEGIPTDNPDKNVRYKSLITIGEQTLDFNGETGITIASFGRRCRLASPLEAEWFNYSLDVGQAFTVVEYYKMYDFAIGFRVLGTTKSYRFKFIDPIVPLILEKYSDIKVTVNSGLYNNIYSLPFNDFLQLTE